MTDAQNAHTYNVGDPVLARVNGVPVPGVIEAQENDRFLVRLSTSVPSSATGSNEAWLSANDLDPSSDEATGDVQALPG